MKRLLIAPLMLAGIAAVQSSHAGAPPVGGADPNQVPNALLLDSGGGMFGNVTGTAPTLWRAVALDGASMTVNAEPLAANALFGGSPPTTAIRITMNSFGTAQVFDHATALFGIEVGREYASRIYVRSGNSNSSSQGFFVNFPTFDADQVFTGRDAGGFMDVAGSAWAAFDGPSFSGVANDAFAHLAVRVQNDGGENSILVALPTVLGPPLSNAAPNPGFAGNGGATQGAVSGAVPDQWRAFAVNSGSLSISTEAVAAGALFPGSEATTAVRLQVTGGDGASEGFDHELVLAELIAGHLYRGEVFLRSGSAGMQGLVMSMPIFDAQGNFTGTAPGSTIAQVGPQWRLVAGPGFTATTGHRTNLAFRLDADGGSDSLLIAAPRIVAPASAIIFANDFE